MTDETLNLMILFFYVLYNLFCFFLFNKEGVGLAKSLD